MLGAAGNGVIVMLGVRGATGPRPGPGVVIGGTGQSDAGHARGLCVAVDAQGDRDGDEAATNVVDAGRFDHAAERHRVAREHGAQHAEGDAAEPAVRTGPVRQVAFEPGGLVGGVQEDVLGPVAVHGEVLVVMHRPPVTSGQGAEDHRRRAHLVVEDGERIADRDIAQEQTRSHGDAHDAPPRL